MVSITVASIVLFGQFFSVFDFHLRNKYFFQCLSVRVKFNFVSLFLEVQCSHYSCSSLVDFSRESRYALLGRQLEKVSRNV